jgi:hypothetical protein
MRNIFAAGLYLNARNGCRLNLIMLVIKIKKLTANNIARASSSAVSNTAAASSTLAPIVDFDAGVVQA